MSLDVLVIISWCLYQNQDFDNTGLLVAMAMLRSLIQL